MRLLPISKLLDVWHRDFGSQGRSVQRFSVPQGSRTCANRLILFANTTTQPLGCKCKTISFVLCLR